MIGSACRFGGGGVSASELLEIMGDRFDRLSFSELETGRLSKLYRGTGDGVSFVEHAFQKSSMSSKPFSSLRILSSSMWSPELLRQLMKDVFYRQTVARPDGGWNMDIDKDYL